MQIITPINIDLINISPLPIINLKQSDTGRGILVTVTAYGSVCVFTTEVVNIYMKKPDGTLIYNACTIQDGNILAMFTNEALAVAGQVPIELEIISSTDRLSTPIAIANILPTNIDSDAIESTNEFTALTQALQNVQQFVTDASAAAEAANAAADSANSAAEAANAAAGSANTAAESANAAASSASTAAENATTAASSANSAAEAANTAASSANSAAEAANTAAQNAIGYPNYNSISTFDEGQSMSQNGYVRFGCRASVDRVISISVNDVVIAAVFCTAASSAAVSAYTPLIPVKSGDVITTNSDVFSEGGTTYNTYRQFFPIQV